MNFKSPLFQGLQNASPKMALYISMILILPAPLSFLRSLQNKKNIVSSNCPECGGTLTLRTAKKGPNAGNKFWGCTAFPKCRYTKQMDEI